MAKTKYTKSDIVSFIRDLDVRAKSLSDTKIDLIINRAYAELTTVSLTLFSNEEIVNLDQYYSNSELKLTLDVEDDVTSIYDLYTTIEGENSNKSICQEIIQDIGIYRNSDLAYRDNRHVGRFHVDLSNNTEIFNNVICKYYYTPKATDEDIFMDSQVYLAFQDAIWASLNYFMKDIEGEAQKRASMTRTSKSSAQTPEDVPDEIRAMFGGL